MNQNSIIPLYLIESFLAIVEESTFEKAALRLNATQSTLSKQMQALENQLPHKIFTLSGRNKILTAYGKALYDRLAPNLSQTQDIIRQSSLDFSNPEKVTAHIAGRGEFLDLISREVSFPGKIYFHQMSNTVAVSALLNRSVDLAVVHKISPNSELIIKPFVKNRFQIVAPKSFFKIAKALKLSELMDHLKTLPFLLYKDNDPFLNQVLEDFGIQTEDLNTKRVYSNYSALLKMAEKGFGWTLVPAHILADTNLVYVQVIETKIESLPQFYLCYRRDLSRTSWFKDLIQQILR